MPALRWTGLTLLALGYAMALMYGELTVGVVLPLGLLIIAGICVSDRAPVHVRYVGHALFILITVTLALHWLPGFNSARVIDSERFTWDAAPFSMYLNLDKPLIGFWVLLACPWVLLRVGFKQSALVSAVVWVVTSALCLLGAMALGMIHWAPKWPEQSWIWLANNLLLVTIAEELLFRGYIQGGLSRLFKQWRYGGALALMITATLFGLAHMGAGWQWVLMAGLAGIGYGLAYRLGGLQAAVITHFGLNLMHFSLFTYPMLQQ